jgi:RNA polymerase sigma factor (sigma-70 family)
VQALQALPRRQREAIALRYLADLSERDVSVALGVSRGSVKTHLHRGMVGLRSALGPADDLEVRLAHGS